VDVELPVAILLALGGDFIISWPGNLIPLPSTPCLPANESTRLFATSASLTAPLALLRRMFLPPRGARNLPLVFLSMLKKKKTSAGKCSPEHALLAL
jgi:hypothetical protein